MQVSWLTRLLFADHSLSRGFCLSWQPGAIWTQAVSDCLVAAAYGAVAGGLLYLGLRRKGTLPSGLWMGFGAAMLAGGLTHIVTAMTIWRPLYGLESLLNIATALAMLLALMASWRFAPATVGQISALREEIEERRRAERSLADNQARFQEFAEAASDWFYETDADFRYTYLAGSIEKNIGYPIASFLGKPRDNILLEVDAEAMRAHRAALAARQPFRDFVSARRHADGSILYIRSSGRPIFAHDGRFCGYRGVGTVVTAEIEAKRAEAAAHSRVLDAIESMPHGIMVFDRNEQLTLVNTQMRKMFPMAGELFSPGITAQAHFEAAAKAHIAAPSVGREADWASERLEQFRAAGTPQAMQLSDGRWLHQYERRMSDGGTISVRIDITDLKQAEADVKLSEGRFRDFAEVASDWFFETDADFRYTYVSDSRERDTGFPASYFIGEVRGERFLLEIDPETMREHKALLAARLPFHDLVSARQHANGSILYVRSAGRPYFGPDGTFLGYRGVAKVITGEVAARKAEAKAHARLVDAIESMPAGIMIFDDQEQLVLANAHMRTMFRGAESIFVEGTTAKAQLEFAAAGHITADSVGRETEWLDKRLAEFRARNATSVVKLSDDRWIQQFERPMSDGGTISVRIDVSDLKHAEAAASENEKRFRDFAEIASDWMWETGPDLRFSYISPRAEAFTGIPATELLGKRREDGAVIVEDHDMRQRLQADIEARRAYSNITVLRLRPDGGKSYVRVSARPMFDGSGTFLGYRGTGTEITKEVFARQSEREAHERLAEALETLPAGVMLFDRNEELIAVNSQHRNLPPEYLRQADPGTRWADIVAAADRDEPSAGLSPGERDWLRLRRAEFSTQRDDAEIRLADGRWCQLTQRATANGGAILMRFDISERKQAEEKLLHMQKTDAIGHLTGGIAHDFNNLLGIVSGNLELIEEGVDEQPELLQLVRICIDAAGRGATLTHSLLAFARKQPLDPRPIDVNELVRETAVILTRALGEQIDVELMTVPDLWWCECDGAQLQSALINLAVNARDAMPQGGKLTIETANAQLDPGYAALNTEIESGPYVMLAISDTGTGMTPEVLAKAFDPFFTTKARGSGSGLGLSMVYGFAKQSRGHVKIYSEVGHGTTVKLYLPRSLGAETDTAPLGGTSEIPVGSETILVAEDDEGMRALTVRLLRGLGYRVFEAGDAAEALAIIDDQPQIALLLTDVILAGGMNGPQLAELAKRLQAGVKVLYMSGYTENAIMHHGRLDRGVALLQKPFRRKDLALKVRSVLDG